LEWICGHVWGIARICSRIGKITQWHQNMMYPTWNIGYKRKWIDQVLMLAACASMLVEISFDQLCHNYSTLSGCDRWLGIHSIEHWCANWKMDAMWFTLDTNKYVC
jgi:hypothetical protein